jgi:SAM-dependent methyltransferase
MTTPLGETATARHSLARFCIGNGLDIGFGGAEPIVRTAICLDRSFGSPGRANNLGDDFPTHLISNAFGRLPFLDASLDYVYSSHTLEDAVETKNVLNEWCRVLKPGGYLVLLLPDQPTYAAYCALHGLLPNGDHVYPDFSLDFVVARFPEGMTIVHRAFPLTYNAYSFELVACKNEN